MLRDYVRLEIARAGSVGEGRTGAKRAHVFQLFNFRVWHVKLEISRLEGFVLPCGVGEVAAKLTVGSANA